MSMIICLSTEIRLVSSLYSSRTEVVRSIDIESTFLLNPFKLPCIKESSVLSLDARSSSTPLYTSSDKSKISIMSLMCFSAILLHRPEADH